MALSKPSAGATGWDAQVDALIDRHNELESFNPSSYATTAAVASAVTTHSAATDPHGDRAYADTHQAATIADDFTLRADIASLDGVTPQRGADWLVTGAQGVGVASGRATSTGLGYLYAAGDPDVLSCDVEFSGSATEFTMTMSWSASATFDLASLLHVNFGATGFSATVRQDTGSFDSIFFGNWTTPLKTDGTLYRFSIAVDGDRLTILAPNGESFASGVDPRISLNRGSWVFWEPTTSGANSAKLARVSAYSLTGGTLGAHAHPNQVGSMAAAVQPDRISGGRGARWQTTIGYEPTTRMPSVTFGAGTISTALSGAHSIAASSIVTVSAIPNGSTVQIESGTNSETVTTNGSPTGTGPYTSTISSALTKAHASGVAAIATTTATAQTYMYYNPENGFFWLPNTGVVALPASTLYFGNGLDTLLTRNGANVLGLGGGDSLQVDGTYNGGHLMLGSYHVWADANGLLRFKSSAPSSATDGTTVAAVAAGTATLVAGSVTVSNASITTGSLIRLTTIDPGGTVGAPYVFSRTAATAFTIKSTNVADTSTVYWEIVQY